MGEEVETENQGFGEGCESWEGYISYRIETREFLTILLA